MSTVNIILAAYNGEKYIGEQIESILASTYTDWSLFVCDDGSTDGTVNIVKVYEKKYPERIVLLRNQKNLGHALNFLQNINNLKSASFSSNVPKYFMFCDQDDFWLPKKIEMTLQAMKRMEQKYGSKKPLLVFTDTSVADAELNKIHHSFMHSNHLDPKKTDLPHLLMENKCIGCTIMINKEFVDLIKETPKDVKHHDWWIALIAATFGKIGYVCEPTLLYRQHENNSIGSVEFKDYVIRCIKSLHKQKDALLDGQNQARSFIEIYHDQLPEKEKKILCCFSKLQQNPWGLRRIYIIKYQFYKSGILRNLGVFLVV